MDEPWVTLFQENFEGRFTMRKFSANFGCTPIVCSKIWEFISFEEGLKPKHLLWALYFLKIYGKNDTMHFTFKVSDRTFTTWVWKVLESIGVNLPKVNFFFFFVLIYLLMVNG